VNFKLTLQYDGTDFHGWQIQPGKRTVQGDLSAALSLLDGASVVVHGSGRTDAGVHAEAQVASVNLDWELSPAKLRNALNGNLERDLRVTNVVTAPPEFHARFSATGKTYVYRVFHGPVMSPFWRRYAFHESRPLDLARIRNAAGLFLGEHEWSGFYAAQSDVKCRIRKISSLEMASTSVFGSMAEIIEIRVTANGFLRFMVRSIAGALLAAGRGEMSDTEILSVIKTGQHSHRAATAPAHGITLVEVQYEQGV